MVQNEGKGDRGQGPKYYVNIEGTEHPWDSNTISVPQIRSLGSLPANMPVIEEFTDGTERTLGENEVVELKPGHRYGSKPSFKRG
ncbi:MAG TPA: hypothetical protein PK280_05805 [Planctomycetota bacterium]|nr:hypothetical protein [Planctomycetota bacterium]